LQGSGVGAILLHASPEMQRTVLLVGEPPFVLLPSWM
jgi:hypothetical protein